MADPAPAPTPSVVPMLSYADAPGAIAFLRAAFGFEELYRMDMPDGTVGHAELSHQGHTIMLASEWTAAGLVSPTRLAGVHAQLHCTVDDVDAHYGRAREKGAVVLGEPVDQAYGVRSYRALDPEGHRWIFTGPLRGQGK